MGWVAGQHWPYGLAMPVQQTLMNAVTRSMNVVHDVLREVNTNAGHIDFGEHTHPWEMGLAETASQTYYEVPLGFAPTSSAPHFGVSTDAWEKAKGVTVGTVSDSAGAFTALGSIPYGKGQVSIFGALLPTPSEEEDHVEGLKDYGVTITGGQVFHTMLGYRRGLRVSVEVSAG